MKVEQIHVVSIMKKLSLLHHHQCHKQPQDHSKLLSRYSYCKDIPHGLQVCLAHGDCDWINDPFQPCVNNDLLKSAETSSNRIVDGIEAIPNSWPWAVRLIFQTQWDVDNNTGLGALCGVLL